MTNHEVVAVITFDFLILHFIYFRRFRSFLFKKSN